MAYIMFTGALIWYVLLGIILSVLTIKLSGKYDIVKKLKMMILILIWMIEALLCFQIIGALMLPS